MSLQPIAELWDSKSPPHFIEASPGGGDASKPAAATVREFLTFQPGFAFGPLFSSDWEFDFSSK